MLIIKVFVVISIYLNFSMTDTKIEVYVEDTLELTVPVRQKLDFLKRVPIFIGKYK